MPSRNPPDPKTHNDKDVIAEQFYSQVSETIKSVFDLTSRIDERVKMLVERQNFFDERVDKLLDLQQEAFHRVTILESQGLPAQRVLDDIQDDLHDLKEGLHSNKDQLHALELKVETMQLLSKQYDTRMNQVFDWVLRILFMLVGGYLLYKTGWQAPPTP